MGPEAAAGQVIAEEDSEAGSAFDVPFATELDVTSEPEYEERMAGLFELAPRRKRLCARTPDSGDPGEDVSSPEEAPPEVTTTDYEKPWEDADTPTEPPMEAPDGMTAILRGDAEIDMKDGRGTSGEGEGQEELGNSTQQDALEVAAPDLAEGSPKDAVKLEAAEKQGTDQDQAMDHESGMKPVRKDPAAQTPAAQEAVQIQEAAGETTMELDEPSEVPANTQTAAQSEGREGGQLRTAEDAVERPSDAAEEKPSEKAAREGVLQQQENMDTEDGVKDALQVQVEPEAMENAVTKRQVAEGTPAALLSSLVGELTIT